MKGPDKNWLPNGCLGLFFGAVALPLLVLTPYLAHGVCIGLGCEGPVREAYIICCNQLVYEPGKEGTGADRTVDCSDYLENKVWPQVVKSICSQLKSKNKMCPEAVATCNSPNQNGNDCYGKMPEKGAVFAQSTTRVVSRIYSEPSTSSETVGNQPNGTRLVYSQTKQVDGQTWYYVITPGRPSGWVSGSEISCTRPGGETVPTFPRDHPPDHIFEGTAAIASAGRG